MLHLALLIGCIIAIAMSVPQTGRAGGSPSPARDINAVLAAHDQQLMKLPNVVGVYVGALPDGKTPCLKVMLARSSPETEKAIPRQIDGYAVVTEVTGEIRPLQKR